MKKGIRRIILLAVLTAFIFSTVSAITILRQYRSSSQNYDRAVEQYVRYTPPVAESGEGAEVRSQEETAAGPGIAEAAPVSVDFQSLQAENGDVIGWIYCEDTPINYPVVQGTDNSYYLKHSYDRTYDTAGCIFIDAENGSDFGDSNTIIYGHHMKNGSMFAALDKWAEQGYYEEHPVMWLLTPGQDYKIELFSGYTTSATSDTYRIFDGAGEELDAYLAESKARSDFDSEVEPDGDSRYVLLTTCAYVFDNARYVIHGRLVPVDSAGGVPLH